MKTYLLVSTINSYPMVDLLTKYIPVMGVITLKDKYAKNNHEYYDYSIFCKQRELTCIEVESYSLKSKNDYDLLSQLQIDLLLVLGWQRLVPDWFINQCGIGAIGVHGSPWGIATGRGRSPQNWALLLGCDCFSVSIFWLDEKIDSGNIIDTATFQYTELDDITTSYLQLAYLVVEMIMKNIHNGNIKSKIGYKQIGNIAYLPKRNYEDGMIDWNRNCMEIYNFIRALTKPYPGAFTVINHHTIHIWRAKYIHSNFFDHHKCGEIIQILPKDQLIVKCKGGVIIVEEYENVDHIELLQGSVFESANFKLQIKNLVQRHYSQNLGLVSHHITSIYEK